MFFVIFLFLISTVFCDDENSVENRIDKILDALENANKRIDELETALARV